MKINLSEIRESEIRSFFGDTFVKLHYPSNISEFNVFIDEFQTLQYKKNKFDNLNVMGNVSGMAEC